MRSLLRKALALKALGQLEEAGAACRRILELSCVKVGTSSSLVSATVAPQEFGEEFRESAVRQFVERPQVSGD